jgi:hypothetical protein
MPDHDYTRRPARVGNLSREQKALLKEAGYQDAIPIRKRLTGFETRLLLSMYDENSHEVRAWWGEFDADMEELDPQRLPHGRRQWPADLRAL